MSDTDPAYIGVEPCGCITAAQVDRGECPKDVAQFVADIVKTGRTVERTTVGEAKAREHFLPMECPHDPKGWEREKPRPPQRTTSRVSSRDLRVVYEAGKRWLRVGEVRKWDGAWEATTGWFNYRAAGANDGRGDQKQPVEVLRPFASMREAIDALPECVS